MIEIVTIFFIFILSVVYYFINKNYQFFQRCGIKYPKPVFLFGSVYKLLTLKLHLNEMVAEFYKQFEGEKYFGIFYCFKPIIVIKDIELVKKIFVKDFDYFTDHYGIATKDDPLLFHTLLSLRGDKWRQMRNTLTPAFTGSKMKEMTYLIDECTERFVKYLQNQIKDNQTYEVEIKDMISKCSTDIIASCAFGIESDTLSNPENEFYAISNILTHTKPIVGALVSALVHNPFLTKIMKMKFIEKKVEDYYKTIVINMIKERSRTGIIRRDMIHLLTLAMSGNLTEEVKVDESSSVSTLLDTNIMKHSGKRSWTEDEITAQAVFFIFAGLDTMATLLSFMCYELAINTEAQTKLRDEVDKYLEEHNNQCKNIDTKKLKYMDMVLSETLRLWPPAGNIDRMCTKSYTLPPSNNTNKGIKIEKGQIVWVPAYSIQRDPKYFKDPEKFIPERFLEDSIDPSTYLPFGIGPRSCIGNRFALMEAKIVMFNLIANFEVVKIANTHVPVEIIPHVFNINVKNGLYIGFRKRSQ